MKWYRTGLLILLWVQLTCVAALNTSDQATVIARYNMSVYDQQINDLYKTLPPNKPANLAQRIEKITRHFLGQPYVLGATGEGPDAEFDKSPLYRTDAFDCTTYVEMTLALTQANNLSQFKKIIKKVRYKNGVVSFLTRNHFVSSDWNRNNINNGYIKDITSQFSVPYKIADTQINKPGWYEKLPASTIKTFHPLSPQETAVLLDKLHALAAKVSVVMGQIKYLPFTELYVDNGKGDVAPNEKAFAQIPSGAIIQIVIPNRNLTAQIGTNLNVVHMGFAIRNKQGLIFREASSIKHRVVDVPLIPYLQRFDSFTHGKGGISIKQIILPNKN